MARPNTAIVSSIEERESEKRGKKGNEISVHLQNTKYTYNVQSEVQCGREYQVITHKYDVTAI